MFVFKSFIMGGYECADHINRSGERVNLLRETQHDIRVVEDYSALAKLNIMTVREGVCWSAVEIQPFIFDFSEIKNRIRAAASYDIQQIWDLCHFGYPDGLYPTHPHFCKRFVAFCEAFAHFYNQHAKNPLLVVPINEISFLSWHSGDMRGTAPFMINSGFDIKYHLCKAAILGINQIKLISANCQIILIEPLIQIHPTQAKNAEQALTLKEYQFQAMDIIMGSLCPELGGNPELVNILGFNYYWDNQWQYEASPLPWPDNEGKRTKISLLLTDAYRRYHKPIFISETGHFGSGRVKWLEEIIQGCIETLNSGVNLLGFCLYPVIDRPDWDDLSRYHQSGIWDLDANKDRVPHYDYMNAIDNCRQKIILLEMDSLTSHFLKF